MTDLQCRTVTVEFRVLAESDAEAAEAVEDVLDRSTDVNQLIAGYNSHTGEAQRGSWMVLGRPWAVVDAEGYDMPEVYLFASEGEASDRAREIADTRDDDTYPFVVQVDD